MHARLIIEFNHDTIVVRGMIIIGKSSPAQLVIAFIAIVVVYDFCRTT